MASQTFPKSFHFGITYGEYLNVGTHAVYDIASTSATFSFWLKLDDTAAFQVPVSRGWYGAGGFCVQLYPAGEWEIIANSTNVLTTSGALAGTLGVWTHWTFKKTGPAGAWQVFKNGVECAYANQSANGDLISEVVDLVWSDVHGNFLKGRMCDIRWWNRALSAGEIKTVYYGEEVTSNLVGWWKCQETSGPTAIDASSSAFDGTIINYGSDTNFFSADGPIASTRFADLKFMTMGHSIVWGTISGRGTTSNSYRRTMYYRARSKYGLAWDFVGNQTGGDLPTPYHDGINGVDVATYQPLLSGFLSAVYPSPTANSCVIFGPWEGADVINATPLAAFKASVAAMIAAINSYSPLIKIFVLTGSLRAAEDITAYAAKVVEAYNDALALGYNVYLVDQGTNVVHTGTDNRHPDWLGYEQMGEFICDTIMSLLGVSVGSSPLVLYDTFTAADGTNLVAHSVDTNITGDVWHDASTRFQIYDNTAKGVGGYAFDTFIDLGQVVCTMQVKCYQSVNGTTYFLLKMSPDHSKYMYFWLNTATQVLQIGNEASAYAWEAEPFACADATWYTFDIVLSGESVEISHAGTVIIHTPLLSPSVGGYDNYTNMGLSYYPAGVSEFDDLTVYGQLATLAQGPIEITDGGSGAEEVLIEAKLLLADSSLNAVEPYGSYVSTLLIPANAVTVPILDTDHNRLWACSFDQNLYVLDPITLEHLHTVPSAGGWAMDYAYGYIWTNTADSMGVLKIDPVTYEVLATITFGFSFMYLNHGGGFVYGSDNGNDGQVASHLVQIDPVTNAYTVITLGLVGTYASVFINGKMWFVNNVGNSISIVDPNTASVVHTLDLTPYRTPNAVATDGTYVYLIASHTTTPYTGTNILKIDPTTYAITLLYTQLDTHFSQPGYFGAPWGYKSPQSLAYLHGFLYVSGDGSATVYKIDPNSPNSREYNVLESSTMLALFGAGPGNKIFLGGYFNSNFYEFMYDFSGFQAYRRVSMELPSVNVNLALIDSSNNIMYPPEITIACPEAPWGAVSDGTYLWVTCGHYLVKILISTRAIVASYNIGIGMMNPCIHAGYLWVPDNASNVVYKFDMASGTVVDTIVTGASTVHPASAIGVGSLVWVTNDDGYSVVKIDPTTDTITTIVTHLGAYNWAFDGTKLWITFNDTCVAALNPVTGATIFEITGFSHPSGIAYDSLTNSIWFSDADGSIGMVYQYSLDGTRLAAIDTKIIPGAYSALSDVTFDGRYIYVAHFNSYPKNTISFFRIDPLSGQLSAFYSEGASVYTNMVYPIVDGGVLRSLWVLNWDAGHPFITVLTMTGTEFVYFAHSVLDAGGSIGAFIYDELFATTLPSAWAKKAGDGSASFTAVAGVGTIVNVTGWGSWRYDDPFALSAFDYVLEFDIQYGTTNMFACGFRWTDAGGYKLYHRPGIGLWLSANVGSDLLGTDTMLATVPSVLAADHCRIVLTGSRIQVYLTIGGSESLLMDILDSTFLVGSVGVLGDVGQWMITNLSVNGLTARSEDVSVQAQVLAEDGAVGDDQPSAIAELLAADVGTALEALNATGEVLVQDGPFNLLETFEEYGAYTNYLLHTADSPISSSWIYSLVSPAGPGWPLALMGLTSAAGYIEQDVFMEYDRPITFQLLVGNILADTDGARLTLEIQTLYTTVQQALSTSPTGLELLLAPNTEYSVTLNSPVSVTGPVRCRVYIDLPAGGTGSPASVEISQLQTACGPAARTWLPTTLTIGQYSPDLTVAGGWLAVHYGPSTGWFRAVDLQMNTTQAELEAATQFGVRYEQDGALNWKDYALEFDWSASATESLNVGLRWTDAGGYRLNVTNTQIKLYKDGHADLFTSPVQILSATAIVGLATHLRIELEGNQIRIYTSGTLVATVVDSDYVRGSFGFINTGESDKLWFDNVQMMSLPAQAGTDMISIAVGVPVIDRADGVENLILRAMLDVLDQGVGTDVLALTMFLRVAESGIGQEALTVLARAFVNDQDRSVDERVLISSVLTVLDQGVGTDSVRLLLEMNVADSGVGQDALSIIIRLLVRDQGTAQELLNILAYAHVEDEGLGQELVRIMSTLFLEDYGQAVTETIDILNSLLIEDLAFGTDILGQTWKMLDILYLQGAFGTEIKLGGRFF